MRRLLAVVALLAATVSLPAGASPAETVPAGADAVVIAVVDGSIAPYHRDFQGRYLPQHNDADPANDLPLDQPPDTWLPGFPAASSFTQFMKLRLTLSDDPAARLAELNDMDAAKWDQVGVSTLSAPKFAWIPDSKVLGVVDFGGDRPNDLGSSHGSKVASVAAGNINGACPECLILFVSHDLSSAAATEQALAWAMAQPWIDVVTNSYGFSSIGSVATGSVRDRLYSGSDVALQRAAAQRGQTIFFSSGNGLRNDFREPNTTYFNSHEGPDWIVTVGGTSPSGGDYTGSGKPADVAGIASQYPSMGMTTIDSRSTFSGTSNATPLVAGQYARALWWARQRLDGPSRLQESGVVARGAPVGCGGARADCELGDGVLTARELRTRLLHAPRHTAQGAQYGNDYDALPAAVPEAQLASEGHGTFWGRMRSRDEWLDEQARIVGPLDGSAAELVRPDGEREWFVVDSYCRQEIWGAWSDGDYRAGETPLPLPSPLWPLRSSLTASCDQLFPPL